jgi:hypothetical protein
MEQHLDAMGLLPNGASFRNLIEGDARQYLADMRRADTYVDQITAQAACLLFRCNLQTYRPPDADWASPRPAGPGEPWPAGEGNFNLALGFADTWHMTFSNCPGPPRAVKRP